MFQINEYISNEFLKLFLNTSVLIFIFWGIGKVFQRKTKILGELNVSISIGFVLYLLLTYILYIPLIIFDANIVFFQWLETIKNFLLIISLFIFFEYWKPKFNKEKNYSVINFIFIVSVWAVFMIIGKYSEIFIRFDETSVLNESIFLFSQGDINSIQPSTDSLTKAIYKTNIFNYTLATWTVNFSLELKTIYTMLVPLISIIIITQSIYALFKPKKGIRNTILYILSSINAVFWTMLVTTDASAQITAAIIIFAIIVLFKYYSSFEGDPWVLNFIIFASWLTTGFNAWGIIIYISISVITIITSYEKEANPTNNLAIALSLLSLTFAVMLFEFSTAYFVILITVSAIVLIPAWTLQRSNKSNEIFNVEQYVSKNINWIMLSIYLTLVVAFSIIAGTNWQSYESILIDLFTNKANLDSKFWNYFISISLEVIYFVLFILSIFMAFKFKNNFSKMYIVLYLLALNPLINPIYIILFNLEVNIYANLFIAATTTVVSLVQFVLGDKV